MNNQNESIWNLIKRKDFLFVTAAVCVLIGFVYFIIYSNYSSQKQQRDSLLSAFQQNIQTSLDKTEQLFQARKIEINYLAQSEFIEVYFANKALQMTMRYGLYASIQNISDHFQSFITETKVKNQNIYSRLALYETETGEILVDTSSETISAKIINLVSKNYAKGDRSTIFYHCGCKHMAQCVVITPILFKERFAGIIIGWIAPDFLNSAFIVPGVSSTELTVLLDGQDVIYSNRDLTKNEQTFLINTPHPKDLTHSLVEPKIYYPPNSSDGMFTVLTSIPDTHLQLFYALAETEIIGNGHPKDLLLALATMAFLLLGGFILILKMNMTNIFLKIRMEEARKNSILIEKNNRELEKEITERKKIEVELQTTHSQLLHSGKLSAIGKLSGSIAHEFNNPIQGIMNILSGIKQRVPMPSEELNLMEMAQEECRRMKDLIASLQGFYRPTEKEKKDVDIEKIIDAVLLINKKDFINRGLGVKTNWLPQPTFIFASEDQMKQVFFNLLQNAAEASSAGDCITISCRTEENEIVITVEDTGAGIHPDEMQHIFDPFFTNKAHVKGTGLGLSISYGIIKDHNGKITVDSQLGTGTVFSLTFPITRQKNE